MKFGKKRCEILRKIRLQVAKANGIDYEPSVCNHKKECVGTCPKCEKELEYLNNELAGKKNVKVHRTIEEEELLRIAQEEKQKMADVQCLSFREKLLVKLGFRYIGGLIE